MNNIISNNLLSMRYFILVFWSINAAAAPSAQELEFFESKIRPVLVDRCYKCHSVDSKKLKGGLLLDSQWGWEKGGESGAVIIPGKPEESMLLNSIEHDPDFEAMPPKSKLSASQIDDFRTWIKMGAPDPRPKKKRHGKDDFSFNLEARKAWWSLQPLSRPSVPSTGKWAKTSYDHFVRARLTEKGWTPAAPANKRTLIRRATHDVTGLPPTPAEIDAFLADNSPNAYDKVIDRLLASPHYGEHWARKWMDLVRYGETKSFENDYTMSHAWKYRDYLIKAFNEDVPYNQFVMEHLAGDLLPTPRLDPKTAQNESIKGPGYLHLTTGHHGPPDLHEDEVRAFDDMINVTGKTFLATTISCARCHDHKFDAVTTADFYSLYGIFASSPLTYENTVNPQYLLSQRAKLHDVRRTIQKELAGMLIEDLKKLKADGSPSPVKAVPVNVYNPKSIGALGKQDRFGDWTTNGFDFGNGRRTPGEFAVSADGKSVLKTFVDVAAAGDLSSRIGGALQSPIFTLDDDVIVRVKGRGASVNLIIQHYELVGNGPTTTGLRIKLKNDDWHDIRFNTKLWRGLRAYLDVQLNYPGNAHARNGPHHYRHQEDAYVAIQHAVFAKDNLNMESKPWTVDELLGAATRWRDGAATSNDGNALNELFKTGFARNKPSDSPALTEAVAKLATIRKEIPIPNYVRTLSENVGYDEPVYIRGLHKNLSKAPNPRRFLDALDPTPFNTPGSGRLQWATKVAAPDNPLTARVLVNRLWYHTFGRGIVHTVDDFGQMGTKPTHPELLDHLAQEFIANGWSIKTTLRKMLLSSTYQMSSTPSAQAQELDPENKLLQHMPVRRLHAEGIRDTVLAVSGRLDRKMYGPSIPDSLLEAPASRAKPRTPGPVDGAGRRSIYIELRRNFLPGFLIAFDMPNATTPFGRRNITNIPAQSLAMMNDPFVVEQAANWAKRLVADSAPFEERIHAMHTDAFARPATSAEINWARATIAELATQRGLTVDQAANHAEIWADFCHVMINRKELIYLF